MKLPKTYKGFLKLMVDISHNGNDFAGDKKLTHDEIMEVGGMIADIQNTLSENAELLNKFNLTYNG